MLTLKTLNKKIKEIENKLIYPTDYVYFIARKYLYTNADDYEKEKQNLINKGFKLIKSEENHSLYAHFFNETGNKETWEKNYATGEY